ncbi:MULTISPECIES: rod-binding protein [unclassified Butyrivibrio]|uniref:rod-binding protein n=1 Tax=unclassified Butyrivibrio TaxID=2639466 RepID=UPI0003B4E185|nr:MULTISPECIES: rod-binding protein [unclassified Butyrivibrio]SDB37840.1 flagellar protein FlgJ [Butyrivibrio sp. INlla16]SEK81644.1 flagellar protein FlgJ [Butyrivibrio sp. ob235]
MAIDMNSMNSLSGISQYASSQAASEKINSAASKVRRIETEEDKAQVDKELMDACKQFEAYFMEQIYKGYEKTAKVFSKDESGSMGKMVDYFKDLTIQDIAATGADKQSVGLAQMLYENMKRNYDL